MSPHDRRIAATPLVLGLLFAGVFAGLVIFYGHQLRTDIRRKMIERDAAVLQPVVQQQVQSTDSPTALLPDARREGTLALALFDEAGVTLEKVPATQLLVELPLDDLVRLQDGRTISRFHPAFPLSDLRADAAPGQSSPVLEIILPLYRNNAKERTLLGFVRYHLDARPLDAELTMLDNSVRQKTLSMLAVGVGLIGVIVLAAHFALARAQRTITERTERLQRANFELTLSSKASALGQITAHLIHGLQGSVAGLHAVVAGHGASDTSAGWVTAAGYTERMRVMIQEAVGLLGDTAAHTNYDLSGIELAAIIRQRSANAAQQKGVVFLVGEGFAQSLDNHRGGLLCLIINNLVQNALEATDADKRVEVYFQTDDGHVIVTVRDEGPGIAEDIRARLFEPGRSGRPGGSGLGLAISQLLARQIGATLELESTGSNGSVFRLELPLRTNNA